MKRTDRTGVTGRGGVRGQLTAGAVGFALVLAACSSSNAGPAPEPPVTDSSTPATEVTTSTTSTTVAPTTTTKPPPVVDTVSSDPSPETTVGDSLPAPTNTTFDPTTPEGEVERAVLADSAAFVVCLEELPKCDVEKATVNAQFAVLEGNTSLMNEWNAAGYVARNTDDQNYRVDKIEISDDGSEAIVTYCLWGSTQLVLPATESSAEVVIEGGYTSSINKYLVQKIGEVWFVTASDGVRTSTGVEQNICV